MDFVFMRKLDSKARITLPNDILEYYEWSKQEELIIKPCENHIIITKEEKK